MIFSLAAVETEFTDREDVTDPTHRRFMGRSAWQQRSQTCKVFTIPPVDVSFLTAHEAHAAPREVRGRRPSSS